MGGLPYTFILFWCSQSLVILVQEEAEDLDRDRKAFSNFIFNLALIKNHAINTVCPGLVIGKTVAVCGKWPFSSLGDMATRIIWTVVFSTLYYVAIALLLCGFAMTRWVITGLVVYIGFGTLLGLVRNNVRLRYSILHGDLITDLLCGIFTPMFTISQIEAQMLEAPDKKDDPALADASANETI